MKTGFVIVSTLILSISLSHANTIPKLKKWFHSLRNPVTGGSCCDESDCKPTKSRFKNNRLEARLPDGSWAPVPENSIVYRENPLGRPVLCALPNYDPFGDQTGGWIVHCYVPGGSS